jgi:hypothetical protein
MTNGETVGEEHPEHEKDEGRRKTLPPRRGPNLYTLDIYIEAGYMDVLPTTMWYATTCGAPASEADPHQ